MAQVLEKNVQMLHFIGFWIGRNEQKGFPFYLRQTLVGFMWLWTFYGFLYGWPMYALQHSDNFSEVSEVLANAVGSAIPMSLFLTLLFQNDDLEDLVATLREVDDFKQLNDEYTTAVIERTKKRCDFINTKIPQGGLVVYATMVMAACVNVFRNRNLTKHLKSVFPFDLKRPGVFEITMAAFTFNFFHLTLMTLGADLLIICMFVNILGQLKILNHKIRVLRESAEALVQDKIVKLTPLSKQETPLTECKVELESNVALKCLAKPEVLVDEDKLTSIKTKAEPELNSLFENDVEVEMEIALAECVDHHTMILIFVRKFEKVWNVFFSVTLSSCLAQSVLVLTSSAMKTRDTSMLGHIAITSTYYSMLGIFCWLAQQVTNEAELVKESVYGCSWIEAGTSFKRSIGIMISMSNRPLVIAAAGFVPMSMETLGKVLNSAYSLYMVMRSF